MSIAVTPANPTIALGTTQAYDAIRTYTDGTTQDVTQVGHWSSSNAAAATISNTPGSQGLASTLGTGTTTISIAVGTVSGTATLTVNPAALLTITLSPQTPTIALGTTQQFTATGTYTDGSVQDLTTTAQWSSSLATVAVMSTTGLATSAGTGTATITATQATVTATTTLTVGQAAIVSLAVSPTASTIPLGTTQQFQAIATYTDGTWDSFVSYMATNFPQIKYWELWDEPDVAQYANPKTWTTAQWIRMASDTRQIIRSINPNAVILSPGPTGSACS